MKWPEKQAEILRNGFQEFLRFHGISLVPGTEWEVYRQVTYDLQYDDSHPAFSTGKRCRIVAYNPEFQLYPDGCNDSHLATVLRTFLKEFSAVSVAITYRQHKGRACRET